MSRVPRDKNIPVCTADVFLTFAKKDGLREVEKEKKDGFLRWWSDPG